MNDVADMLQRQAAWQRSRAGLSWTEKVRLAARLRDAALAMRESAGHVRRAKRTLPRSSN